MISRRNFLATTGSAGVMLATGSCHAGSREASVLPETAYRGDGGLYLEKRAQLLETDPKIFLGYPGNKNLPPEGYFRWRDELFRLEIGKRMENNIGDPFRDRGFHNAHYLEAQTIERFGARFGFDREDVWGFITNSGTDSNMHGAYIGRTLLTHRTGVVPRVYYTRETHYSIEIIRDLLAMREVLVDTLPDGAMDPADLTDKLKANKDAPALVLATIGTTFKGAIDDIDKIQDALRGYESYVHLDAALFGGFLQASEYAGDLHLSRNGRKRYDSISVSCHKFFGFPMIAGIFVTTASTYGTFKDYFSQVHNPAYISHVPGTISCSRNLLSAALFHYFSTDEAFKLQQADASRVMDDADYLQQTLASHFPDLEAQRANNRSNIVHFNRVSDRIKKKWHLATVATEAGESLTHVVVMPHATRHYLDRFLADLESDRRG